MVTLERLWQTYDWYRRHVWSVVSHRRFPPAMVSAWSHYLHSFLFQPASPSHLPFDIQLEITTVCNLRCITCRGALPMGPGKHMTFDTFRKVVDQLPILYRVLPQGLGEPLLNPDLYDMVEYASRHGCAVEFHTNAMFLDRKRITRLMDAGLYALTVSIDGSTPQTFETIRAGAKMSRVIANLETLHTMKQERGSKLPHIRFHVVVTKPSLSEVPDIIQLAHKYGVEVVILSPLHVFAPSMQPLACDPDEWSSLYRYEWLARDLNIGLYFIPWEPVPPVLVSPGQPIWTGKASPKPNVSPGACHDGCSTDIAAPEQPLSPTADENDNLVMSSPLSRLTHRRRAPCRYPWTGLYITVDGDILPCSWALASGRQALGNVKTDDFRSIWWGEKYQAFRRQLTDATAPLPAICATCPRAAAYVNGPQAG